MTDKSVKLNILSNARQARSDLEDITARADQVGKLSPSVSVSLLDRAGKPIDVLEQKVKRFDGTTATIRANFADADASAHMDALAAKIHRLNDDHVRINAKVDEHGRGGIGSLISEVTGFSAVSGVASKDATMFSRVLGGLNIVTGVGEPLMAGLIVATAGLSSALMAGGLGMAGYGVVLKSQFATIGKALQATSAKARQAILKGMDEPTRHLYTSVKHAQDAFKSWSKSLEAPIDAPIAKLIAKLPMVLKDFTPLTKDAAGAMKTLLGQFGRSISGSGFKDFLASVGKYVKPDIIGLGQSIGHIVVGIGGILKAFLPASKEMTHGLDDITAKFAHWGQTLSSHTGFKTLMSMFKTETPIVMSDIGRLVGTIKNLVSSMAGLDGVGNSKTLFMLASPILKLAEYLSKANPALLRMGLYLYAATSGMKKVSGAVTGLKEAGSTLGKFYSGITGLPGDLSKVRQGFSDSEAAAGEASGKWGSFGGAIKSVGVKLGFLQAQSDEATVATEGETAAQTELDGAMDANPIGLIVVAIAALAVGFVELWKHCKAFRDFWIDTWKVVKTAGVAAWHFLDNDMIKPLMHGVSDLVDWVRSHWKLLATIIATVLLGPIGGLVVYVATHWSKITALTGRLVGDVVRFLKSIPGKLAALPGELFDIGRNVVLGIIHGIESMFGDVAGAVAHLAGLIPHGITSLLHMLSPSKVTFEHGRNVALGLIAGMDSMHGEVSKAVERMALAAGAGAGVHAWLPAMAGQAVTAGNRAGGSGHSSGDTFIFNIPESAEPDATARLIQQKLLILRRHKGGTGLGFD